jgi:hypothetical protein
MSGSSKGRVLPRRPLAQPIRTGSCAWCGADCVEYLGFPTRCQVCKSTEIDWLEPPEPPAPTPHTHVANTHTPGSIAYCVLGGFVRSKS